MSEMAVAERNHNHVALEKLAQELSEDARRAFPPGMHILKKEIIDFAFQNGSIKSVAELGCVWNVDGIYGRYIGEKYNPAKIMMVDLIWNARALALCAAHPSITTVTANFATRQMVEEIGPIDCAIFFDILLHMVSPDWGALLEMYAPNTKTFLIANPQFISSTRTTRLLDLPRERYLDLIPDHSDRSIYAKTFDNPYQFDESQGKPLRDSAYVWQWGITNRDLVDSMDRLGFDLTFSKRGPHRYGRAKEMVQWGFVFERRT